MEKALLATVAVAFSSCADIREADLLEASQELTESEESVVRLNIEEFGLSLRVFAQFAPHLDPLFDAHGVALEPSDANAPVINAMGDFHQNLELLFEGGRIRKISRDAMEDIMHEDAGGAAIGTFTDDTSDDYILITGIGDHGTSIVFWSDPAPSGTLVHEASHFVYGPHDKAIGRALDELESSSSDDELIVFGGDGYENSRYFYEAVVEHKDFPYLCNFSMSASYEILGLRIPADQRIEYLLESGQEFCAAVVSTEHDISRMAIPFERAVDYFVHNSVTPEGGDDFMFLSTAGLTAEEARVALEPLKNDYNDQAEWAAAESLALMYDDDYRDCFWFE